ATIVFMIGQICRDFNDFANWSSDFPSDKNTDCCDNYKCNTENKR
ncbi:hypothetical protein NT04LM_3744, partial [Listeria monocytogenes FSL F2-208]